MHMVTILPIPILRITIVREPQLSAGFAGKSRNRGTLMLSSLRLKSATQVWHSESEQWHSIQVARLGKEEKYAIFSSKSPVP